MVRCINFTSSRRRVRATPHRVVYDTSTACKAMPTVHLLDYVAGNVRSLVNAIEKLGYTIEWIKSPKDVADAEVGAYVARIN